MMLSAYAAALPLYSGNGALAPLALPLAEMSLVHHHCARFQIQKILEVLRAYADYIYGRLNSGERRDESTNSGKCY